MVDILPRGPTLAEILGGGLSQGFSQGVSSGLDLLAKERIERLKEARGLKQVQGILDSFGIKPDVEDAQQANQVASTEGPTSQQKGEPSRQFSREEIARIALAAQAGPNEAAKAVADIRKEHADTAFKERQFQQKDQHLIEKETAPYRTEIRKSFQGAKNKQLQIAAIKRASKGNLTHPLLVSALDLFPIDASALLTNDTVELEKLRANLAADSLQKLGGRITNFELKTLLKGLASARQTEEQRERIIQNMEQLQIAPDILRGNALREIIKENGGNTPKDIFDLVEDRVAPELDKLAEQIKAGIPVSEETGSFAEGEKQKNASRRKPKPGYVFVIDESLEEGQVREVPKKDLKSLGISSDRIVK